MKKDLLIKFLENRCTSEEFDQIIRWIGTEALSESGKDLAFDDWNSFHERKLSADQEIRMETLLDKIHHQINIKQTNTYTSRQENKSSRLLNLITRVAAVLLIPVLSVLIYVLTNNSFNSLMHTGLGIDSLEVVAPPGSRTMAQLADGTKVYLNSGSKVKYPRNFNGANRAVSFSGEGFFEVVHDPKHPFIVKTKRVNVKALGTKFNVMSYSENDAVATTLVEGKVVLEEITASGNAIGLSTLVPGQHVEYHVNTGKIFSKKGNIDKYIAWKDGLIVFDNSSMDEVAQQLERTFNVEIETTKDIKDYTYTVKFVDESLSQILELLTKATPVEYVVYPRVKLPDGTYSKQKIQFKKR